MSGYPTSRLRGHPVLKPDRSVYQGKLALLLAVDPAAPVGDRLIGYALVDGPVDQTAMATFVRRLQAAGISPEEVITDGSSLYPALLAEVWPTAAQQLCLFHETRHVTDAVAAVLTLVRRSLPTPPPRPRQPGGGRLSDVPPTRHRDDPTTQQWHLRRARRHAAMREVHALARQGYSQTAIALHTGRHRRTIRRWLSQEIPVLSAETEEVAARVALDGADAVLRHRTLTPARQARLQDLARQGLSHSAIARLTGLHRVTVSRWLKASLPDPAPAAPAQELPDAATVPGADPGMVVALAPADEGAADATAILPPPAPWTSWAQVWQVREALQAHRWLLRRRPEHLTGEQQAQIDALVASPVGDQVGAARRFLLEWYALWRTEDGQRRSLAEAQDRYDRWRTNPAYYPSAVMLEGHTSGGCAHKWWVKRDWGTFRPARVLPSGHICPL